MFVYNVPGTHFHGFMYQKGDNTKAMPIYDLNGVLAGIQTKVSSYLV